MELLWYLGQAILLEFRETEPRAAPGCGCGIQNGDLLPRIESLRAPAAFQVSAAEWRSCFQCWANHAHCIGAVGLTLISDVLHQR
jgi:hypothetical protein